MEVTRHSQEHQRRIAAEISWARTADRSTRIRLARQAFLKKFEKEVDPAAKSKMILCSRSSAQRAALVNVNVHVRAGSGLVE
jgi:hypothetical protein